MVPFNTIHSHIRLVVRGARLKNRRARLNRQLAQDIERSRFRLFLADRSRPIFYILGEDSRVSSVLFIHLVKIAHLGERGHRVVCQPAGCLHLSAVDRRGARNCTLSEPAAAEP
jgi:hypothetical protein